MRRMKGEWHTCLSHTSKCQEDNGNRYMVARQQATDKKEKCLHFFTYFQNRLMHKHTHTDPSVPSEAYQPLKSLHF